MKSGIKLFELILGTGYNLFMSFRGKQVLPTLANFSRVQLACLLGCGAFSVAFGQAPLNDDFTNAIPLYGSSVTFTGTLANATIEAGESFCECSDVCLPGGSVWWSWTATNSTAVIVDTVGYTPAYNGADFAVCTGSDVNALTALDCNFLGLVANRYVPFAATAGTTYYIRVQGTTIGSFSLRLTATNAPMILTPPPSRTLAGNSSVMFSVVAAGLRPLKYQWQFQGNNLPGQTVPTLLLHRLSAGQAGGYSVVVSNSSGVTTSVVANLVVLPAAPLVQLAVVNSPDTNRFYFTITGETGRKYQILATTNLINWAGEASIPGFAYAHGVVQNTNETSLFSVPRVPRQKFLRTTPYVDTEICIAQLEAINFAIKLFSIESHNYSILSPPNVIPYLQHFGCPSGTPGSTLLEANYFITDVATKPVCEIVPALHVLP